MSYSIEAINCDCYEGTNCLINKMNIRDEQQLSQIEADITFAKSSELEQNPICGVFDFEHYRAIHKYLFEDLYDWAGKLRSIDISKKGTQFCRAELLDELCNKCFARLIENNLFKGLTKEGFIDEIVDFYCTTNMLHPFREGNGRTQRIFITQLIRVNGYEFNFSDIDTDELMIATIQSANGVNDFLKNIFINHINFESV